MTKERRLGRGLEALLGQLPGWNGATPPGQPPCPPQPPAGVARPMPTLGRPRFPFGRWMNRQPRRRIAVGQPAAAAVATAGAGVPPLKLPIDSIQHNPHQPRQDFDADELQRLADSITSHGLLQPVVVRPWEGGYQLIAGERRLRAARLAGWTEVPVTIVEADERQTAELAIVENLQRKDLNALEKAASFQRYLDQYGGTQEELAGRLKLDRSTIANLIRLLELPGAGAGRPAPRQDHAGPRAGAVAVGRGARASGLLRADPEGRSERAADRGPGPGDDRRGRRRTGRGRGQRRHGWPSRRVAPRTMLPPWSRSSAPRWACG